MLSLFHISILSTILFIIGFSGTIFCRNLLSIFLSIEIMTNSASIIFVAAGNFWKNIDGQILYITIMTVIASEASIFLILLLQLHKKINTLNIAKY
ncbi:NADH-quinone oxidoreductase subunit K [Candidatus Westeberhardia cardiocondylae]|uniref:NADH-quinone oxidoreductase subunit K n=2 Tax=Candidatus Westeberhardia cardiocondylae TaxID=1594731 RepID=A0A0H5BX54_9ENTR|nr:NADH-quinone oxidoreductase subunit NuoK [Candidatus Westeberhardia cardiocondylae]CEN32327.1 NADH-quinone oxidoreductase subunit K [Candidatus Westeberhardia cardiocondylae]